MARPKGSVNVVTRDVREAFKKLLEKNTSKLSGWLDEVEDPAKRIELICRLAEYVVPKLGRTEVTGKDGGPVVVDFSVDLSRAKE